MMEVSDETLQDVTEAKTGLVDDEGQPGKDLSELSEDERTKVEGLMGELVPGDSHSIVHFGSGAQSEMTTISQNMMEGVKNKDSGPAGDILNDMMSKVRGLDTSEIKEGKKPGFFRRMLGAVEPIAKFMQQYESVESQVVSAEKQLHKQIQKLSGDVEKLDRLYNSTLTYYRELEYYIIAGEMRLKKLDEQDIPAAREKAEQSDDMVDAQSQKDLQTARDDIERKIHDLKLTRQAVMQFLPTIRMTQEVDKSLINKMNSSIVNTLNLWRTQMAQAIAIANTREAAGVQKTVTDANNEFLTANAENLKEANAEARKEIERGAFDIESVEQANQTLIDTIEESLEITREGREKRAEAEQRLGDCEVSLKDALRTAT
ncbi:toxic anion resistance protein [Salicola sp. Rm-C-2C1-2]|uniref:toxic anion resistance protein n=1 Tax=Salicola sp. Rm-C-2C1-2 TaxID=3141321 RepID=UPI0032E4E477